MYFTFSFPNYAFCQTYKKNSITETISSLKLTELRNIFRSKKGKENNKVHIIMF